MFKKLFVWVKLLRSVHLAKLKADRRERGVVYLGSDFKGLEPAELVINGVSQGFDWDKAMLLVKGSDQSIKYEQDRIIDSQNQ